MTDQGGLLVVNAMEIATLAGGVRRGSEPGLTSATIEGDGALAVFEGRIVAVGRRTEVEARLAEMGIEADQLRRSMPTRGTVTPGLIDPHTHLLFAGHAPRRGRTASAWRALPADPRGGRRHPANGRARRAPLRRGVTRQRPPLAGRDAQPRRYDRRGEVRLRPGHGHRAAPAGGGGSARQEGPIDVVPTFLGAHAVAPEFRDRPDATEAYMTSVIDEQLPAVVGAGRGDVSRRFLRARGVRGAGDHAGCSTAARASGLAARLHADETASLRRGRTGRRIRRSFRRPPGRCVRSRASRRSRAQPTTGIRSSQRCCRRPPSS